MLQFLEGEGEGGTVGGCGLEHDGGCELELEHAAGAFELHIYVVVVGDLLKAPLGRPLTDRANCVKCDGWNGQSARGYVEIS